VNQSQTAATLRPHTSEWFNALSHGTGALMAVLGMALLMQRAQSVPAQIAFFIYGVSLIVLMVSSTVYHSLLHRERVRVVLQRIDHISIYLLIAGTYTPPCVMSVPPRWGMPLLALVWVIAAAGTVLTIWMPERSRIWSVALYLAMGWAVVLVLPALLEHVPPGGLWLLVSGGLAYTLGAIIYAARRPDPLPAWFGFHGLWHVLVLAGAALHFLFVAIYVPVA